jgi:TPR repeat protein
MKSCSGLLVKGASRTSSVRLKSARSIRRTSMPLGKRRRHSVALACLCEGATTPSAEQGFASAQFSLGLSFRDGQGVLRDYVEAYTWLDLAAGGSSATEKTTYANARDALAKTMTIDQVAEAQKRTRWWLEGFERRQR